MSFKSGDIIENLYHKDNHGVISQNMKTAKVIYMNGYPVTMGIKILEHEEELLIGACIEVECREEWFKTIETIDSIEVLFSSYDEYVGSDIREYTKNNDGSINLIGKLFGIDNIHIPKEYIDYDTYGKPKCATICIHDGTPNRI